MFRNLKVSSLLRRRIEKGHMTRQNLVVFIDMIQTLYLDIEYIIEIADGCFNHFAKINPTWTNTSEIL